MQVILEANSRVCGKFGMNLQEAKDYFMKKVNESGLTFCKIKETDKAIMFDLYPRKKEDRGENFEFPWDGMRKLGMEFGGKKDEGGDPPYVYLMYYEKPVPVAPKGEYMQYNNR